ncbi:carbonic anhydrase [Pseudokineococcus sp. 1T1Z-3]|uniref:carbonic anhydrase n=1 Tax=Pseudokineococcus sp. 1T1Z-3 TaxID=3132745 RepID=UPI00309D3027
MAASNSSSRPEHGRPSDIWASLLQGNARWVGEVSTAADARGGPRRTALVDGQEPRAVILGCSDSRVPAEILFDQGIGDLFVVRTAGHVVDDAVLGSVQYAVDALHVNLVVVLGHDRCGAVDAAAQVLGGAARPDGAIGDVVDKVLPCLHRAQRAGVAGLEDLVRYHAVATAEQLQGSASPLLAAIDGGRCSVVAAVYSLDTGIVTTQVQSSLQLDRSASAARALALAEEQVPQQVQQRAHEQVRERAQVPARLQVPAQVRREATVDALTPDDGAYVARHGSPRKIW